MGPCPRKNQAKGEQARSLLARTEKCETAGNLDAGNVRLGQLPKDIDAQTLALLEKGGQIAQRPSEVDISADDAHAKLAAHLTRADELYTTLDQRLAPPDTRLAWDSMQIDNLSIRDAYPASGQQKLVTCEGNRWKGNAAQSLTDRWINIYIYPSDPGSSFRKQILNERRSLTSNI